MAETSYLNIDDILLKPKFNRVHRIGVELEGGWAAVPKGYQLVHDGSVSVTSSKAGEIPIGPMQVGALLSKLKFAYPSEVNKTCGMHVHMSFATLLEYSILADSPAYQETVVEYMTRWAKEADLPSSHPIWSRLKGENSYCLKKFWPEKQMHGEKKNYGTGDGSRYTMISYQWGRKLSNGGLMKTIECRLLPMMYTPELAHKAIIRLVEVTNCYLIKARKNGPKVSEKVQVRGKNSGAKIVLTLKKGEIYEEYYE